MIADYDIVDVDTHYYQPSDRFTRYMDPAFRDRAVYATFHDNGNRDR